MSFSAADLAAIDAAIKNADFDVEIDGQRVRYRQMSELLQARALIASQLAISGSSGSRGGAAYRYKFLTGRGE